MEAKRAAFLDALAQHGHAHDQQATARANRLLNITPDTGPFLALLLKTARARAVLEIGTSNGYSTIWLADAVEASAGQVTTVEASSAKVVLAQANFMQAGVTALITQIQARVEEWLPACPTRYDFIFLDADRAQYVVLWPDLLRVLLPSGLLVVDNVVSHQAELVHFSALVAATSEVESLVVPVGKGEMVIRKLS